MPEHEQLTSKICTSVNCGPAASPELFTRPGGLRPGREQPRAQLYSPGSQYTRNPTLGEGGGRGYGGRIELLCLQVFFVPLKGYFIYKKKVRKTSTKVYPQVRLFVTMNFYLILKLDVKYSDRFVCLFRFWVHLTDVLYANSYSQFYSLLLVFTFPST